MKIKTSKRIKRTLLILIASACLMGAYILTVNFYVVFSQDEKCVPVDTAVHLQDVDYAVVLGCGIKSDGRPSDMLYDRLVRALELMNKNTDMKLIVSGDNSGPEYNEVGVMYNFFIDNGIDKSRLIEDNIGFSTGESMENFKNSYGNVKVIIITQKFHLYRALFIAEKLGIEAYGLEAVKNRYAHEYFYSLREIAARNKDFLKYIF